MQSSKFRWPWRSLPLLLLPVGLVLAIDSWLPHALISYHNRSVNPAPSELAASGLESELLTFSADNESNEPVTLRGWLLRAPAVESAPTLIFLHSLGGTREDVLKRIAQFLLAI